ncbi:Bug family tripartite tricarboxylate transporter substrate binding protein [Brachybacterium sacelli]|uniref:Tripartite-type tricarboxylate transporter receptor subunit TctC n=2 Tax=Brachybacterium sacelli TaxID=173364 RepID=A0ABS4WZK7_9MICO|nr:tripartite tricarboxylate transporter substrate binding protein [Brachybacterium sacelli]MBP2381573.1 tripartite-type tricarboxylate transporter receptor subunit TctC [Brachybacterium sacelli]
MKVSRRSTLIAAPVLAGLVGCSKVSEEGADYPTDDLRLIIQADPGGGSDLSSRALAKEMESELGVSVVPENMPGAAGAIAMEYVGEQPADGYVIGFCPVEIAMLNTTQNADVLPENYTFIGQIMLAPGVISVAADSPYATLEDLIEAGASEALTVGTAGAGSIWEAATLGVNSQAGTQFSPVPYDGGAPAVAAAAAGETDAAVSGAGEAIAQGDSVRILGIMHDETMPDLPDTPTFAEAIGEDIQFGGWGGIYTAADLPQGVLATLEAAVRTAVESDSYQEFQENAGNLVVHKDAEEFTTFVQKQFEEFQELLG